MIRFLVFDSKIFGKKIGRLEFSSGKKISQIRKDLDTIKKENFDCVYFEIPDKRKDLVDYCKENHIYLAGTRETLKKRLISKKSYLEKIKEETDHYKEDFNDNFSGSISKQLFKVSRFYTDPFFRPIGEKLYDIWVRKSLYTKYSVKYFTVTEDKLPVGLATLRKRENKLYIDLFCVLENYRKKGYGTGLLTMVADWAYRKGYKYLYVYTQKDNTDAMSVYNKAGFRKIKTQNIYHLYNNP